ncbi:hypothetical protein [Mycolicibacterium arseniciresistens]|uniref:Uncharacterized protein n=1 Tax=Mycolicibacterium arseniciresistens TaxID=3062257 RepID=A0ABT8UDJ3_9MYCO|nr:hypothetical protein [Mycolicibacterium arseniciresistens]MDO3634438.1 hypothetical protein [Mycolicibacterium arseniciresistens]
MDERRPERTRPITPRDVFQRSNMPSRWERLTSVSPKTAADRKYLAFVAARYRGDGRLPHPDQLATPSALRAVQIAKTCAVVVASLALIGIVTEQLTTAAAAGGCLAATLIVLLILSVSAGPQIRTFHDVRTRAEAAQSRLHADRMDAEDSGTLNEMITHDEGTLAYCAAKIAAEIEQDPGRRSDAVGIVPIDLWDEVAEVGASARQIAEDRRATETLEWGRLRDEPDVRAAIEEDRLQRKEAIALLAARVHAFADYRDRVHRDGMAALRELNSLNRMVRLASDEQAGRRPL